MFQVGENPSKQMRESHELLSHHDGGEQRMLAGCGKKTTKDTKNSPLCPSPFLLCDSADSMQIFPDSQHSVGKSGCRRHTADSPPLSMLAQETCKPANVAGCFLGMLATGQQAGLLLEGLLNTD